MTNRHWKLDVVYNTTPLPRRRDSSTHKTDVRFYALIRLLYIARATGPAVGQYR